MKLVDKIRLQTSSTPLYTFEFFPPRTDQGFSNLLSRISRLSTLHPLAISVTWGAGGSTRERSLELAAMSQAEFGVETLMHFTCTNMEIGMVDEALKEAKERGIQNILALRGDPPRGSEYWIPTDPRFVHAVDLVRYIRSNPEYASYFCIGVAAYPDGHTDGFPEEEQIAHLKAKIDAGADFIITQLFYDVEGFKRWIRRVRAAGITVPILPGIMPIQNYTSFLRLTKLCGTKVPAEVAAALEPIRSDDQKVKDYGIELATSIVTQLTTDQGIGIKAVHFCTLNLEKSVRRVLTNLGWSHEGLRKHNQVIDDMPASHHLPADALVSPIEASEHAKNALSHPPSSPSLPEQQQLEVASAEMSGVSFSWDEFPNGRFGDSTSPAYGIGSGDQWDPGARKLGISRSQALSEWGSPTSLDDLSILFERYLRSDLRAPTTPFSPDPILAETQMILPHLLKLTAKGWWTVGSQPAVDAAPSGDEVVGWGPPGGYVFQKSFVEFFCDRETVAWLRGRIQERGAGYISYFAGNMEGELLTNLEEDERNAVTWGVFPGQEIAQSTIIERAGFLAWKEEAFSIWSEWALLYPPNSPERVLLEGVRNERWLVSVVSHDFKDVDGLWRFLLED